jgi:lipopolysaccharide transport system permease protein
MSTTEQPKTALHPGPVDIDTLELKEESGPGAVETVIRPRPGWIAVNWGELLHSHELFYTLVLRDLKIRYKQTVLGIAWAVIQPVLTMIVFTFIFGRMMKVQTGDVPYPLFVFAGLVPWTFFSNAVSGAALSLLTHQNLLTKIYFPRLYVPAATVGGFLVDLGIGLVLFVILMPFYHYAPGWGLLALPLVIVLSFAAALGIGLTLAAATLLYRDLRFVIPFALQIAMFVSPVIFSLDKLPRPIQYAAALNPMFGIINAYRSSILGLPWDLGTLAVSMVSTGALLVFGLFFFRKTERLIADIV